MEPRPDALSHVLSNGAGLLGSITITALAVWWLVAIDRGRWTVLEQRPPARALALTALVVLFFAGVFVTIPHLILTTGWFSVWQSSR